MRGRYWLVGRKVQKGRDTWETIALRGSSTSLPIQERGVRGEDDEGENPTRHSGLGEDYGDKTVSIMGILVEYLSFAFLVRSKFDANQLQSGGGETSDEERGWVSDIFDIEGLITDVRRRINWLRAILRYSSSGYGTTARALLCSWRLEGLM